jgi:hypothetical protein
MTPNFEHFSSRRFQTRLLQGRRVDVSVSSRSVAQAKTLSQDEAVAEMTRRYFISHGPATLKDYAWWSSLSVRNARQGIDPRP